MMDSDHSAGLLGRTDRGEVPERLNAAACKTHLACLRLPICKYFQDFTLLSVAGLICTLKCTKTASQSAPVTMERPIQAKANRASPAIHAPRLNGFSLLTDARRPGKRSSICVSGKMKNPPMTTVRIDALGVTHRCLASRTPANLRN